MTRINAAQHPLEARSSRERALIVVLIWLLQVFELIGPVQIRIPPLK